MTHKSWNIGYVKQIRRITAMGVGLLLAGVSLLNLTSLSAGATRFDTPVFFNEQKLTASDGTTGDFFGNSVAVSGSILVVGAPFDSTGGHSAQGSAYVFKREGGNWVEEQKLTASDGAAGDQFGRSVAISGSTIVVGAWVDDINGDVDQGSAYVFKREGGNWVEEQKLSASDGVAGDKFGWSVAVSGSTIAISVNSFLGWAYVFNRQGGNWVEEQKLTASDGVVGDHFGWSIAISGSTIVVGTAILNAFAEGSAYVFNREGRSWVETQKLTASDGAGGNIFGWSVAINGSTIVVGAWGGTVGANLNQGAAYLFTRQGRSWVENQKLIASDGAAFDEFGWSVAISGSTIVVSAELEAIGGNTAQGFAYVFNRTQGSWVEEQKLTASDGAPGDRFGWSISASGSTAVLGAPGNNFVQGSAYIFEP
ncbi:MAG TPA: FG-GAP repeat protein [Pyrinomonadaceae bacterium]|nr:FG-GAP repeat protein [Pyrinomonadaceae bacterium]